MGGTRREGRIVAGAKRRATRKQSLSRICGCSFLSFPQLSRFSFSRTQTRARVHLFRSDRWYGRVFVSRLAPTIVALPRQNGSTIGSLKKKRERERAKKRRTVVGSRDRQWGTGTGGSVAVQEVPDRPHHFVLAVRTTCPNREKENRYRAKTMIRLA